MRGEGLSAQHSGLSLAWLVQGTSLGKWDRVGSWVVRKRLWLIPGAVSPEEGSRVHKWARTRFLHSELADPEGTLELLGLDCHHLCLPQVPPGGWHWQYRYEGLCSHLGWYWPLSLLPQASFPQAPWCSQTFHILLLG